MRRDPACPLPLLARYFAGGGLQQAVFIAGNFTAQGLHGLNKTWPDFSKKWGEGEICKRVNRPTHTQKKGGVVLATGQWVLGIMRTETTVVF